SEKMKMPRRFFHSNSLPGEANYASETNARHRKGLSFPLEYFHRIPCFIGRGLFVFQRTVEVCFCQVILGVKFQEAREQNFRLNEIAIAKLANSFLVRFQPDQQFLIEHSVTRLHDCKDIDRLGLSFDLCTRDGTQMKFVANQI